MAVLVEVVEGGILSLKLCFPGDTVFASFKGGLVLGFGTGGVRIGVLVLGFGTGGAPTGILVLGFGTGGDCVFGIDHCLVLFNEDGL